jgi:UDP-2-acetamido-2,6-beta-L-arabino-hexul-4-ose reductase
MMKILVTGAKGFIGKNLVSELKNKGFNHVFEFDTDTDAHLLEEYCKEADFVFHLAGVNRPKDNSEFMSGNFGFTSTLLEKLKKFKNSCPVMLSSSIQAELTNPYGESKKAGEDLMLEYSRETGAKVLIYRFPNVFGKWCRPNYNSAVATFCYNIANDLPVQINNPSTVLNLVYIDDVVEALIRNLDETYNIREDYYKISKIYTVTLEEIVQLIYTFKSSRQDLFLPDMSDEFTKKLYSTYLSYLPENEFSYALRMNTDHRGSFTEFLKTSERGQVSVNISKPGITKGNHWHHTKNEKFLVVSGKGVIRFRDIHSGKVIEYFVSGDKLEVVDIPVGYTHNIENLSEVDMVTIMWANEVFNSENPDTYYLEV